MKNLFLLFYTFLLSTSIQAQYKLDATIITKDKSEINCEIGLYEGQLINDDDIEYWVNNEKKVIKINQIDRVKVRDRVYIAFHYSFNKRMSNRKTVTVHRNYLGEILVQGEVSLYAAHFRVPVGYTNPNGMYIQTGEKLGTAYYLISDEIKELYNVGYKKILYKAFPKCMNLKEIIKSRKLKYRDLTKIVQIGNECSIK